MEYYSATIVPFAATWTQLEIITLSEVSRKKKKKDIPYDITYIWNLKYGANGAIYKTETDLQT